MTTKRDYPMGSVSTATMRPEDLIPTFVANLYHSAKVSRANGHCHTIGDVSAKRRKEHVKLVADIEARMEADGYYESDKAQYDLEALFNALEEYAAPYFYFGSHPGDGADYGYWLPEGWEEGFEGLKVSDTSEIPTSYRGEVIHVNDHGNVTLYAKSARKLVEIWSVV